MQPEKIIRSYYVIAGLYTLSASLIWGVNTLFLLEAGLDILEVFIANAFFSVGMAVFEIPTGVLADTRGRRLSFLLSLSVLSLGTLGYVSISLLGGGLALFSLMSVILGLGYTFYSGAVEAWLVDALNAAGYRGSLDQVFARNEFISGAAMLVGTVGGGLLGQIDLAIPFIGRSLLLILLFGFAFVTMHDLGYQPRTLSLGRIPEEMKAVAQASLKFGLGRASLRLIFLMSLIQSGFLYWGFYAWQPYFLDLLGQDAVWVAGVIAAFISLATMTGNGLVEWLTRICGKRTTLILWATAIGGLATIGVGLTRSFWVAVILLLVYMATTGVTTPVIHAYMHQVIPSGQRAAILSLNSMVGSGGGILAQAGLGYISRASSIASGYILGGAVSLLVLPVAGMLRRLQEPADVIVGRAGLDSTCAAQGIPEISGLETDTHPAASK